MTENDTDYTSNTTVNNNTPPPPEEEEVTEIFNAYWDGNLPTAKGNIANEFSKVPHEAQLLGADTMSKFLTSAGANLSQLKQPKPT